MVNDFNGLIGIDLGTTYSCAARLTREGVPQTVPNREGELITPSVLMLENGLVIVGREAQRSECVYPERTAVCVKRDMGTTAYGKPLMGESYRPELLSAMILKRVKADVEVRFGPVRQAVITVPAYFDDVRRKATQDAGRVAGLSVLDIINEPTAAALAFAFEVHRRRHGRLEDYAGRMVSRPLTALVYDLGGGTFDVSLVRMSPARFETLATDGDVRLGGRDWDERLVDDLAEEFSRQYGSDPRENAQSLAFLFQAAEQAKRALSARTNTRVLVVHDGKRLAIDLSRERFERLTADLLLRTRMTTELVVESAGLTWNDIDRVLLVGGMTRCPQVRAMLHEVSGREPDCSLAADEVVAHGAALHGGLLLARAAGNLVAGLPGSWCDFQTVDVNAHSLGVAVRTETGYANSVLIPRNTPLPASSCRKYHTSVPNQRQVRVRLLEGEAREAEACAQIGELVLSDLPPLLPERSPIEVECSYGRDGRISVVGREPASGRLAETSIERQGGLHDAELDAAARRLETLQIA